MTRFAAIITTLALFGCATSSPETRIRSALINAGLSRAVADCMAERLVDRLSITQLRRLNSLAKLKDKEIGQMTVQQFLHHVRALQDPHILRVVTSAGIGCAIAA